MPIKNLARTGWRNFALVPFGENTAMILLIYTKVRSTHAPCGCCQTGSEHPAFHFLSPCAMYRNSRSIAEEFLLKVFHIAYQDHTHLVAALSCSHNQPLELQNRYDHD